MKPQSSASPTGVVASLHLHPEQPGAPLTAVEAVEAIEGKGILGDPRYFGKLSRDTGLPTRRQVTLVEREQIAEHAAALSLPAIEPGVVRSNIETSGVNLIDLLGQEVEIGQAILRFYAPRDPCAKMDAICQGLRARMMDKKQGVLAEVVRSGKIAVGDVIRPRPAQVL